MKPRILVVEDERVISEPLAEHLERDGFDTEVAATLAEARAALERAAPDVILLDVMLPDGDGRDLAREVRKTSDVPVIMVTARGVAARMRAIMRRGHPTQRRERIEVGELVLDPASRTLTKSGEPIELAA